ncbi:hypothetical protein VTK26DRAFT_1167 [Humicola hyalothermophila]
MAALLGLTEVMPLTPLDFTAPQNYIVKVFSFPFRSGAEKDRLEAVEFLKTRLERVFTLFPFLGGLIIHAKEGELPRLVYSKGRPNVDRHGLPDNLKVFSYQVLDCSQFPWTFEQLSELGNPADLMKKDLFWLVPKSDPAPGDELPPIRLRATFIKGGLLLGFSFHHGVMDGGGTVEFLQCFAKGEAVDDVESLTKHKAEFIKLARKFADTTPVDLRSMDGYDFTAQAPPVPPKAEGKIFSFSSTTANSLHKECLAHLRAQQGPNAFISVTDVLCGLLWFHVTRVRLRAGRIRPDDTTRFATAVNVRGRLNIKPGYIGNMFLRALAATTVEDLAGPAPVAQGGGSSSSSSISSIGASPRSTVQQIARAAQLIRKAVQSMSDPCTLQRHLAIATRATDPSDGTLTWTEVDAAVRRAIARHSTGLDATVGVELGGDVEFDIPGTGSGPTRPAWVRRAYVPFEGSVALLPRPGGRKGDADWEVSLGLREEDMRVLEGEEELGAYLCRPAA